MAISAQDLEALQLADWLDSLDDVLYTSGRDRVRQLFANLQIHAQKAGVVLPVTSQTPYVNTIDVESQPPYPGNLEIEKRIRRWVRWNAMAMVVRANNALHGIGGHIATYASIATMYEVGLHHFFRGDDHPSGGDLIYYQGHSIPGLYARSFMEGRFSKEQLANFRRELAPGGGLSSYPHPHLMPDFWRFPTVSMGLGPIMAIYRARMLRYIEDRGLKEPSDQKVVAFLGDGETDEPETLGAITLASREGLDNLIFVVNCNLQRLDGPVRGNGKIIQELEAIFRGAGWNVIKVLWGSEWDPLLAADRDGLLANRMMEVVDGAYQRYKAENGTYVREHFFGSDPKLMQLVSHMSDDDIWALKRGGHDPLKVYAAYHAAYNHKGAPTVILAKTIKGYGMGEAGEAQNVTHQQKQLESDDILAFRDRFHLPLTDEQAINLEFYRPPEDSVEYQYIRDHRRALGGPTPVRLPVNEPLKPSREDHFDEFMGGTDGREVSTTMVFVRLLTKLLKDETIGPRIVPIVPDEARTFGMEPLFRQCGIYAHAGQLYEPVDIGSLLHYKEKKDGQILEEGITEAGSMCSFIAAGTTYAMSDLQLLPFFIYYSMFGFQRVGDLVWAAGDMMCRGFMLGGTAGRTTLAGEGLQHQDGHSHVLALPIPNLEAYDCAYSYELAVVIREGMKRMYEDQEDIFYYLTLGNENYAHPPMPEGAEEDILRGLYRLREAPDGKPQVHLVGSASILNEVVAAQALLHETFGISADVWSATSYKHLQRDALDCERWNLLHPDEEPQVPHIAKCLGDLPVVAASDYMKVLSEALGKWLPEGLVSLGTDGFGRSEGRAQLRDFFEVDDRHVAQAALSLLATRGAIPAQTAKDSLATLEIDPERPAAWYC